MLGTRCANGCFPRTLYRPSSHGDREAGVANTTLALLTTERQGHRTQDRNASGKADLPAIKARPLGDLRYLVRTSPPIPDVLIQEAHKLIEADEANTQH
jgi:hypothetical protein